MDEKGYIKFNCDWKESSPIVSKRIARLNKWREELYKLGLIGVYDNGIGFGNISERVGKSERFIITGSATGGLDKLDGRHYTVVEKFNLEENSLMCKGPIKASSESMTHGAVYKIAPNVNGVIHVHNLPLWKRLLKKVPTTSQKVEYGTPEMAREVVRLITERKMEEGGLIVMAGHREGIVAFGKDLDTAGRILLDEFKKL